MPRRTFLGTLGALGLVQPAKGATDTGFEVHELKTISLQRDRYHGWPTLVQRKSGELLVVCSGGRESHVCPFGRVELIRSADHGQTWSYARTILDGPIDDRDAGIVETAQGTLLVTTFTSLAYEPELKKITATQNETDAAASRRQRWEAAHRRLPEGRHAEHLGCWMLRSDDDGLNWSAAYRVPVNSPHGPITLADGTLFYAGVALWEPGRRVGYCTSSDDGRTWSDLTELPVRAGDDGSKYHELHAVQAADGRILVQIRNHNSVNSGETLQTHSTDGGRTFSEPRSIGVWGLPSHLLKLSDGRLLMTYGHRRAPLGNQARLSDDHGQTWSAPLIISSDGSSGDLGYPSTAEIAPGRFVTMWYERLTNNPFAQLRQATWSLRS
ncbi:MAG: sialidase family protein [Planctomycetaceae bacterium]